MRERAKIKNVRPTKLPFNCYGLILRLGVRVSLRVRRRCRLSLLGLSRGLSLLPFLIQTLLFFVEPINFGALALEVCRVIQFSVETRQQNVCRNQIRVLLDNALK